MLTLKTKTNPFQFEKKLGKLLNVYNTTISSFTFALFLFLILTLIISIAKSIALADQFNINFFIWATVGVFMVFILIYLFIAIRFTYVATFERGLVIKKRYRTKFLKYKEIKKVELRNLSIVHNLIHRDYSKRMAIDLTLHNSKVISIGESFRIIKYLRYPRYPSTLRVLNIKKLYNEIENVVH